ncbi:MAG: class II fumarate hydratase, partial [Acetobacteraceae bacterium]
KQAAAEANRDLGTLAPELAAPIIAAAAAVAAARHDEEFLLPVWQIGSGTAMNMNANEVIANLANCSLGRPLGARAPIHPNDHVNLGQSSNDSFPTMMHLAAAELVAWRLLPALGALHAALSARAAAWAEIIKIGRTHLMDAVPMTLGQAAGAWARQVELGMARVEGCRPRLHALAQGGTAIGTGLNCHPDLDRVFCERVSALTGLPFIPNPDKFEGMGAHDAFVELSGALNVLAVSLTKIANDIRLLGSGPQAGIGEFIVPADGLSSSIMPGKTNPTQCEALSMVAAQVMGNHATITIAGAQSFLELNVFKPVILYNALQSITLLADAAESFAVNMVAKLEPARPRIAANLGRSLMLVTALTPAIGYDRAVAIAKLAATEDLPLREAALRTGYVTAETFDRLVVPAAMLGPRSR